MRYIGESCIGSVNPFLPETIPTHFNFSLGVGFGSDYHQLSFFAVGRVRVMLTFIVLGSGRFRVGFWLLRARFGLSQFFKRTPKLFFQVINL